MIKIRDRRGIATIHIVLVLLVIFAVITAGIFLYSKIKEKKISSIQTSNKFIGSESTLDTCLARASNISYYCEDYFAFECGLLMTADKKYCDFIINRKTEFEDLRSKNYEMCMSMYNQLLSIHSQGISFCDRNEDPQNCIRIVNMYESKNVSACNELFNESVYCKALEFNDVNVCFEKCTQYKTDSCIKKFSGGYNATT